MRYQLYLSSMMNSFYIYLLLVVNVTLVQFVASELTTPEISYISPKQFQEIGKSVDLQCTTRNALDFPIIWEKIEDIDTIYISTGTTRIVPDHRYSLIFNTTTWTTTLKIQDLRSLDAGLYRCVIAIARDNQITADVEVEVLQPSH